ncbi:MAG: TlyA family RNA methyltransferase [Microcoleus sp. PH2017_10_PVI_O_A]|uniref:TlyA family RNA methyltransferase n=1 Tax=unclassified Microcoleus TaxID=2642155 RepID=UPI001D56D348|nr:MULTISPECIES: TlyA family RNA methyltransferase [unclassified Microcoleus]TAE79180.1 MAG: TlyA family RNA methyltransferase [Oscillatoriales cyanobacterium]MCC3408480.1 TlyA family RNA methyltransferase [Microcoleus sp. PH2017_10_PVI_O_A]MCC3462584.1 TlyA family RNA methyltransferase [Microcoleus sp. PH2017_11_PCY_U_A]MCC3481005.1 TlyA family RNA methyltransferase [Microcoleus sp. PH2017_12_PCY_D_A]MCC3531033.1 TlyA family RNA methyltransferase [Microcoleus sp. PH2017_21_RUC_O_A]
MAKQRIDTLLVDLDLCTSRQQAQALIRTGQVSIDQQVIDKPGTEVDITANILIKERSRYVSRGGDKLAKALEIFAIPVAGRICLDGGISTGGFTDCLLQAGATLVYGIDVGYGQADWRLRNDPRVILKERTNLRYMTAAELYGESPPPAPPYQGGEQELPLAGALPKGVYADLAVVDVSFISLDKVLPALWELLVAPREAVLLVKPQFEVGRDRVGKKGVVRDSATQADAIFQVWKAATALGWQERGLTWSPLLGPAGNIEYLLWLGIDREQEPDQRAILFEGCANEEGVVKERIAQVAKAAAQELVK